jgi:surface carbohydrate biosynthesis protein
MNKVVIPVEIKSRELLGKIWFATKLVTNNCIVYIGDRRIIEKTVFDIEPDFYLALGTGAQKREYIKKLSSETILGVLDSEGAPRNGNILQIHDPECMDQADIYFSWGRDQAEKMRNRFGNNALNIVVSGTPEFDLLHQDLNHIYYDSTYFEANSDPILFLPNFTQVNHYEPKKRGNGSSDKYRQQKRLMLEYKKAVKILSVKNNQNIIVRPHPVENANTYRKMFDSFDNVNVYPEGAVRKYIKQAKAVIHTGSTAGVESKIMGAPTLLFNPVKYSIDNMTASAGTKCENLSDLMSVIDTMCDSSESIQFTNKISEEIKSQIYNSEQPVSADIISRKIHSELQTKSYRWKNNIEHTKQEKAERLLYKCDTTKIIDNNQKLLSHINALLPDHNPSLSGQRLRMFPSVKDIEVVQAIKNFEASHINVERVRNYSALFKLSVD